MKRKCSWPWVVAIGLLACVLPAAAKGKKKVKQVVIKEVTRVEGKIQKPEVWYLLPRSNLNFEGFKLEKKLVPKIEQTAKKEPF
ncbi:MAG: hypothetical protein DRI34_04795 [Deltaproteobacteria bacterium]|nr:MAG: hypothetical protein DRI34_04795 [Deltaproteobacteria bacterium]